MNSIVSFIKNNELHLQKLHKNSSDWMHQIRKQSLTKLEKCKVPTMKDEEWKYTNIAPLFKHTYTFAQENHLVSNKLLEKYLDPKEINIVFVNGILAPSLSSNFKTIPGLNIYSKPEESEKANSEFKQKICDEQANVEGFFSSLNQCYFSQGVYIDIEKGCTVDPLIHIIHIADSDQPTVNMPRIIIQLKESSQASILESFLGDSISDYYFINSLTSIYMDPNTTLFYAKKQVGSSKTYYVGKTTVFQKRDSSLNTFSFSSGTLLSRHEMDVHLLGEGSFVGLYGLYTLDQSQHIDNHTSINHMVAHCKSQQLYKGILSGQSRAVFNGKVFVAPTAQLTNSYQLNKNLLLGQEARVNTKPQLEIFADDVKCSHGATVGQLNEDEIFYLQTRNISRKQAIQILAKGFIDDVLNEFPVIAVESKVNDMLESTLKFLI